MTSMGNTEVETNSASTVRDTELAPNGLDDKKARQTIRGKDWSMLKGSPGSIPIQRTIQVVVRRDHLAILPDDDSAANVSAAGSEIPLNATTSAALDEFVSQLHAHIENWGIAGRDLHWRPVLKLNVGPGGQQRAGDLARLLKNSGIEVTSASVADRSNGDSGATR
jgi:hypothetical protein